MSDNLPPTLTRVDPATKRSAEYINADALRGKLGGYHDSDLLSLAESLRTFHDNTEATMERLQAQLDAANARIAELETEYRLHREASLADFLKQSDEHKAEIERLKSRVTFDCRQLLAERDARIAELEAAQRWISVDERLPEKYDNVLTTGGQYIMIGWISEDTVWYCGLNRIIVTHWIPLPPPPVTDVTP